MSMMDQCPEKPYW